jgi:hypothetical protein
MTPPPKTAADARNEFYGEFAIGMVSAAFA